MPGHTHSRARRIGHMRQQHPPARLPPAATPTNQPSAPPSLRSARPAQAAPTPNRAPQHANRPTLPAYPTLRPRPPPPAPAPRRRPAKPTEPTTSAHPPPRSRPHHRPATPTPQTPPRETAPLRRRYDRPAIPGRPATTSRSAPLHPHRVAPLPRPAMGDRYQPGPQRVHRRPRQTHWLPTRTGAAQTH